MKKVFVSMPMNGKSDKDIHETMVAAGIELCNLFSDPCLVLKGTVPDEDVPEGVNRPLWMLGRALQTMAEMDVAYFAPGWDKARGCRIEHLCADEYGIPIKESNR